MQSIEIRQMTREDIGPAQHFYALRGYIPDGAGVYYEERVLPKDADCRNDDQLTICLVKEYEERER